MQTGTSFTFKYIYMVLRTFSTNNETILYHKPEAQQGNNKRFIIKGSIVCMHRLGVSE